MSKLSDKEFWFISVYTRARGFGKSHRKHDIWDYMKGLCCYDSDEWIASLIKKNVLSESPDKQKVKFTDYGVDLFRAMKDDQKDWDSKNIIKISTADKDEILIRAGENFIANRFIRDLIKSCSEKMKIIDPYMGSDFFDLLEDLNHNLTVEIITSDQTKKTVRKTYLDYRSQYPNIKMKILPYSEAKFHDRFIIIDEQCGFHFGYSLKDLGKRDSQINKLGNISKYLLMFGEYWQEGNLLAS
ncbi:MAG: hypothetical protein HQL29_01830 [Candidatus Omnitrophica bacterium]|nr:hypothetical protein [Candidatus Omnitrophota bacterium]